jgi:hypothetical protein
MSRRPPLGLVALGLFGLGVAVMIPFEFWFTRVLGVGALFGAIVVGVFAIATPEFLESGDDEEPDAAAP